MQKDLNIALLGGGVWVIQLVRLLGLSPFLPPIKFRLLAQNQDRLNLVSNHCTLILERTRAVSEVFHSTSLDEVLTGADVVVCMIRVGGFLARRSDEKFPKKYGVIGDEGLGLGGMANALRSASVVRDICEKISLVCPKARVLNLMAPLGITTRQYSDHGLDAVGVCELPFTTERKMLSSDRWTAEEFEYGGFNHLGWFWPRLIQNQGWQKGIEAIGRMHEETVGRFNALPLSYYFKLFEPQKGQVERRSDRADQLFELSESVLESLRDSPEAVEQKLRQREMPWFDQAIVPILEAMFGGTEYRGFLNLKNSSLISGLPQELVVEVRANILNDQIYPIACERIPTRVRSFLESVARIEDEVYFAAKANDEDTKVVRITAALAASREAGMALREAQFAEIAEEIVWRSHEIV